MDLGIISLRGKNEVAIQSREFFILHLYVEKKQAHGQGETSSLPKT